MKVRGIRGATTVSADTSEDIFTATKELIEEIIRLNDIEVDDVASVLLTLTPDLSAAFPARAVRSLPGWQWVPLMCAQEIGVPDALPRSIRVLLHVNTDKKQEELVHAYLGEAVQLRPDLAKD
ncbi:chorismate mutase [Alicyclobacillus fastidiosus]|uniref:chorismate mutase n=1 Tax=Alicyclobacillus fastidiosus TaxID=392011 RepID=A0ABY6ZBS6_9BACL|nr:chorismate mutase [Alicyclobacillus fastidiosus]WAH39659.1 chorismate mutase [Alicyclobacillus fastidiosus]GMA60868.1 chorismate mutase AroH [Alicyclobacillus fastidiosus]